MSPLESLLAGASFAVVNFAGIAALWKPVKRWVRPYFELAHTVYGEPGDETLGKAPVPGLLARVSALEAEVDVWRDQHGQLVKMVAQSARMSSVALDTSQHNRERIEKFIDDLIAGIHDHNAKLEVEG